MARKKIDTGLRTKRSIIFYKKGEKIENLYQILGEVERKIQELSQIYAELPDSRHRGIGGKMKPTLKQKLIQEQIERAEAMAERLMKLIEKER